MKKLRKFLSILLVVCLTSGMIPSVGYAAEHVSVQEQRNHSLDQDYTFYHTVTFNSAGITSDEGAQKQLVRSGERAEEPAAPSRMGYLFDGWYSDGALENVYDFDMPVTDNLTLYAKWIRYTSDGTASMPDPDTEFAIKFLMNDGSNDVYEAQYVTVGDNVKRPGSDPERKLYRFTGWYTDIGATIPYDFATSVTSSLVLYAGWGDPDGSTDMIYSAEAGGDTVYSVSGIEMAGGKVISTINVNSSCVLAVSFFADTFGPDYSAENDEELFTVAVQTPRHSEMEAVEIPVEQELPDKYLIKAVLLDENSEELCEPYLCIRYTAAYHEFSEQTVGSFLDENRDVIIFGADSERDGYENRTDNFGVIAKDVKIIQSTDIVNTLEVHEAGVDGEDVNELFPDYEYMFTNTDDTISSLESGDKVYVSGTTYLFKIKEKSEDNANGSVTLIPDKDCVISEFYDVIKTRMTVGGAEDESGLPKRASSETDESGEESSSTETETESTESETENVASETEGSKEEEETESTQHESSTEETAESGNSTEESSAETAESESEKEESSESATETEKEYESGKEESSIETEIETQQSSTEQEDMAGSDRTLSGSYDSQTSTVGINTQTEESSIQEQSSEEESATEEPSAQEQSSEEESATEEPSAQEQSSEEESATEEPSAQEQSSAEPSSIEESSVTEETSSEDKTTSQDTAEELSEEETTTEEEQGTEESEEETEEEEVIEPQLELVNVSGSGSATIINRTIGLEYDDKLELTGSFSGTFNVDIEISYDAHLFAEDYLFCSVVSETEIKLSVDFKIKKSNEDKVDKAKKELSFGRLTIGTPVPGLTVKLKPSLPMEWEIAGAVHAEAKLKTTNGFEYNSRTGMQKVDKKEKSVKFSAEAQVEIKIGPKIELGAHFLEKVLEITLSMQAGIKVSASVECGFEVSNEESKHACTLCVDGSAKWFVTVNLKATYQITQKWKGVIYDADLLNFEGWINFLNTRPGAFFISIINDPDSIYQGKLTFGGGECKNKTWRTTIKAKNEAGTELSDIEVNLAKNNSSFSESGKTVFMTYLYDGTYQASGTINRRAANKSFTVNGRAQEIILEPGNGDGRIVGNVCDSDTGQTIAGADIIVYDGDEAVAADTSSEDGGFSFTVPAGTYAVIVSKEGYISFSNNEEIAGGRTTYMETVRLVPGNDEDAEQGGFSGMIRDALTGNPVEGVRLDVRSGWNNFYSGDILRTMTTDSDGHYQCECNNVYGVMMGGLPAGNYTVAASKEGYVSTCFNVVVIAGIENNSGQDGTISTGAAEGDYQIVLTWGEHPSDLDSHVVGTLTDGSLFHVYYGYMSQNDGSVNVCNLDVDDVTSFGPETITLSPTTAKPYYYYVYHYAGDGTITTSSAQIKLYQGSSLIRIYNVPGNQSAGSNWYWNVFAIVNGRIVDRNTITSNSETGYASYMYTSDSDSELMELNRSEEDGMDLMDTSSDDNTPKDASENNHLDSSGDYRYEVIDGKAYLTSYRGIEENLTLPATVGNYEISGIRQGAFKNNTALKSITFSEGLVNMEPESIVNCRNLECVNLPASLIISDEAESNTKGLGGIIGDGCNNISTITVPTDSENLCVYNGTLYTKDKSVLIYYPPAKQEYKFEIPDGVKTIASNACSNNPYINEIIMPDTVTYIGYWAFWGDSALQRINISNNCETIGQYAFNYTELTQIQIPASIKGIMPGAFSNNSSLKMIMVNENNKKYTSDENGVLYTDTTLVSFPAATALNCYVVRDGVSKIADYAFANARNLKMVTFPNSMQLIESGAFNGCKLNKLYLPVAIRDIKKAAFLGNEETLRNVYYAGTQEQWDAVNIGWYNDALLTNVMFDYNVLEIPEDMRISGNLLTISGLEIEDMVYNGAAFSASGSVHLVTVDGDTVYDVPIEYMYCGTQRDGTLYESSSAPQNAGEYELLVSVGKNDEGYIGKSIYPFVITPRNLRISAEDLTVYTGSAFPPVFSYRVEGLCESDKGMSINVSYDCSANDTVTKGTYRITPKDAQTGMNYEVTSYIDGKLVIVDEPVYYNVTFNTQGHGNAVSDMKNILAGSRISKPDSPTAPGYHFRGWYKEPSCENLWDFASDTVENDVILYAKWEEILYSVTFNMQGHGSAIESYKGLRYGDKITEPKMPKASEYVFTGWYIDKAYSKAWNFSRDTIQSDLTLYANWIAEDNYEGVLPGDTLAQGDKNGLWIAEIEDYTYNGKPIKPEVHVYYGNERLRQGWDYTVSFKNNTRAAESTEKKAPKITVKCKNGYKGTVSTTFTIQKCMLTSDNLIFTDTHLKGKAYIPVVVVNGSILKPKKDYTLTYKKDGITVKTPAKVGKYEICVQGKNNCEGSFTVPYIILDGETTSIIKAKVKINAATYGNTLPKTVLTIKGQTLKEGTDYTVSYVNTNAKGTATAIFKGNGKYSGVLKKTFKIKAAKLPSDCITIKGNTALQKGGAKPEVIVRVNGIKLVLGVDYSVIYKNNKKVGKEALIIVKGKGNYSGNQKITFVVTENENSK